MEPFGYLDLPVCEPHQDLPESQLKYYARVIAEQHEERLLACLFRESADNPFKKKFTKIFFVSASLMILSMILLIWGTLIHMNTDHMSWQVYIGFSSLIAATVFASLCRGILRKYVQSVIQNYYNATNRPAV